MVERILIHCWTEHRLLRTSNPLAEICYVFFGNISVPFPYFKTKKLKVFTCINKRFGTLFRLWPGEVSAILQALHIRALLYRSSGEMKFDSSSCMLKPVFVKTMLQFFFFANYTFCQITSTFAKTNEQTNRDDSFETCHFDEGRPCYEPPCTSLVQRSRMLMQNRPLLWEDNLLFLTIIT